MTTKKVINNLIAKALAKLYGLVDLGYQLSPPPSKELGDYATNMAMVLAKKFARKPMEVGQEIVAELNRNEDFKKIIGKVELMAPGFINFYLNNGWLVKQVPVILKAGKKFGGSDEGKGQTIVLDYSAPNIAKKMHIGHLRSTVIGAAIYNLYSALGYRVIRDNHLGDWGTQFGKLIYEYKKIYGKKLKKDITVEEMEKLYIDFHQEAKDKPALKEAARAELKKLQDKEKFNFKLWQLFYKTSLIEFKKIYQKLEVDFEEYNGESFYHNMLGDIVAEALDKKVAEKSEGAVIIRFDKFGLPPLMIQKSDGAYLYGTTDLATIKYRRDEWQPTKNIYVVANQQALHFEQLFQASKLLGYHASEEMAHVKFGLILGRDGKKMSTREGEAVDLEQILSEGVAKAKARVREKNKDLDEDELNKIAEIIALGAIKYNDLSQNRLTDIVFDWDKMLSFDSESSPYLQYTSVRVGSILKKVKAGQGKINWQLLTEKKEIELIKIMTAYPEIVKTAAEEYKPNLIALFLMELARAFHSFYEAVPIGAAEEEPQKARVGLIRAVALVMENGLNILGIKVPEKM